VNREEVIDVAIQVGLVLAGLAPRALARAVLARWERRLRAQADDAEAEAVGWLELARERSSRADRIRHRLAAL